MESGIMNIAAESMLTASLSLVKEDPEKNIPKVVRQSFEIYPSTAKIQHSHFCILFGTQDYQGYLVSLRQQAESLQSICAKALTHYDVAWKWETCEKDPTCIICSECFEKSNHEGHKIRLQRGAAGCCDCGDVTAWDTAGFCSDHQGYQEYTDEEVDNLLPTGVGKRAKLLFSAVGEYLHLKCIEREKEEDNDKKNKLETQIITITGCISTYLNATPLFIHFATKMFSKIHPLEGKVSHQCSQLAYIDEEHKGECELLLAQAKINETAEGEENVSEEEHVCTCTLLSKVFRVDNIMFYKIFSDYVIYVMFQSLRFKTLLGITYVANYKYLLDNVEAEDCYIHLGVQILTIPEITMKILKTKALREIIFERFKTLTLMDSDASIQMRKQFYWVVADFKYMFKEESVEFLLKNGGFEEIVSHYYKLCMIDAIEPRKHHIMYYNEGYNVNAINIYYNALKIGYKLVKEIDYWDLAYNQRLATLFYGLIVKLKPWWTEHHDKKGYLEIPLLRTFSLFLSRYILTNLAVIESKEESKLGDSEKTYRAIQELLEGLFNTHTREEIEHMIDIVVKVSARTIGFVDEIRSDKWVNYGLEIGELPKLASKDLGYYYLNPDFVLLQWMILLSNRSKDLFRSLLEGYSTDGSMANIFTNMIFVPDEFEFSTDNMHKEISNLKQMLYFINTLMSNDRDVLYLWRSFNDFMSYDYDKIVKENIDKCFRNAAKYESIHALVKWGGSNIKTIMGKVPKQMADSEEFEKSLNSHSKYTTNREGTKIFNINPKYMSCFNSFYYSSLNDHTEALKHFEEFYKPQDKNLDQKKMKEHDPLNIKNWSLKFFISMVRENMIRTEMFTFLINLLKYKDTHEFIDKDVEEYTEHLLKVILSYVIYLKEKEIKSDVVDLMKQKVAEHKEYFDQLQKNGSNDQLTQLYARFTGANVENVVEQQEAVKKSEEEAKKKRKAALAKRKALVMKKMAKQRNKLAEKCGFDNEASASNWDSASSISEQDNVSEAPKWQKWYEYLLPKDFVAKPYGYLAAIVKTKLYLDSWKQTFKKHKELDLSLVENEETKSNIENLKFDTQALKECEFLDKQGGGVVVQTCKHMIHYDCLSTYKVQNFEAKQSILLVQDFSLNDFNCPLCKHYSNTIIPPKEGLMVMSQSTDKLTESNISERAEVMNMFLDLINMLQEKTVGEEEKKDILIGDIAHERKEIIQLTTNYINHCVQLTDVKGLSWILGEKANIRALLFWADILSSIKSEKEEDNNILPFIDLKTEDLFTMNVSAIFVQTVLHLHYKNVMTDKTLASTKATQLLKIGYAFILLQIAAKITYEVNGFQIKDKEKLSMQSLVDLVKNMDAPLKVSGQSVDISTKFVEGSLTYLRKATAIMTMLSAIDTKSKAGEGKAKMLNKLSNDKFSTEPANELSMLLNLLEWDIETTQDNFSFYGIIEKVQTMDTPNEYEIKEFKNYFDSKLSFGINKDAIMEPLPIEKAKSGDVEMEEEKIDTSMQDIEAQEEPQNSSLIPNTLYLISPDFYFTLPKLPETLEELTRKYYNKKCKLCNKISKRGALCLICMDYMWIAKCKLESKIRDYEEGTLTKHAKSCGDGLSVFIGPVEGQLIYMYNGLAHQSPSPYVDKYGERFDEREKKYETYNLDPSKYNEVRSHFMNFEIPNYVINKRANSTTVFRQNVL